MALKAAAQHFTYSTVSATSSQDSQPADCDWTVCYMLALSCGGVVQKKNLCDSKWKWHSVSGVCVWICVVVLRDPSTPPEAKKKITCLFFDLCDVTRTLSCSSQGLNICNDCVLNKPPSCFFLFKPSLLLLLYNHQVTTHTRMLYIELFIIKDCTLIFQSTYYMYKWRADRFQYFYPLNWAGTLFFFFFALLESEQAKYIKALAAVSWNGDVWKLKKINEDVRSRANRERKKQCYKSES